MGLLDKLFHGGDQEREEEPNAWEDGERVQPVIPVMDNVLIYSAEFQYEPALDLYCKRNILADDELTAAQKSEIFYYSSDHIGMLIEWLIVRDYLADMHLVQNADAVLAVKARELTGTQFFMEYLDGKLMSDDIKPDVAPFVVSYAEKQYLDDYSVFVVDTLHKLPLEYITTWEDFDVFSAVLDDVYKRWRIEQGLEEEYRGKHELRE